MTEFFRKKMAFFRQVHAFVVKTVRSLAGVIRVADAVAGNAQAVVVEGDAWVRNQLIYPLSTDAYFFSSAPDGIMSDDMAAFTASAKNGGIKARTTYTTPLIAGHMYMTRVMYMPTTSNTSVLFNMQLSGAGVIATSSTNTAGAWNALAFRGQSNATGDSIFSFYDIRSSGWDEVKVKEPQLIDLTQLCNGDAAKIATITSWADLVAQYPEYARYVAYDTGTVVGLQPTVKVTGKNLIDDRIKYNPSQTWTLIGSTTLGGGALLPPGKYYWNVYYNGGAMPSGVTPYISYNGRTEYRPHSFTLTEPSYVHCRIYPSQQNTAWSSYTAQVELGSEATPYEPYYDGGTASTQTLYAAGTAHDTQDAVSGEVTRRIGAVDMGTLDWFTNGLRFYATVEGMIGYPGSTKIANILCHRYIARPLVDSTMPRMYIDNSDRISVVDDNYTDKNTFKAAMSGVMLYYELATPTTSSVTAQPLALQKGSNSIYQTDAGRTASFEMTYTATQ